MNLEAGDHRCRLTPQTARELGAAVQQGLLSRLEIRQQKGRRWSVEYRVAPYPLASAANFAARIQSKRDLDYIAAALDRKVLKSFEAVLSKDMQLLYQYTIDVCDTAKEEARNA